MENGHHMIDTGWILPQNVTALLEILKGKDTLIEQSHCTIDDEEFI